MNDRGQGYAALDRRSRPDLHRTLARIKAELGDGSWISILGNARLDLADRAAYRALMSALDDRSAENWCDMPHIQFQGLKP
jgi:hypothetical protein